MVESTRRSNLKWFPRPLLCQQSLHQCKRFWDSIGKSERACLWGSKLTLTWVIVTSLVLDGTDAVFLLCFQTVLWARRCSIKQKAQAHRRSSEKMPLHVMQEDKCDIEVFFNNAAGKCSVIGPSSAGNHWRTESFCLRQRLHALNKLDKTDHKREQKHFYLLMHQCLIISPIQSVGWPLWNSFCSYSSFWKTFHIQQVIKWCFR